MPIYEFQCEKCGKDSELLIRSSNWQGTKCPHCGSEKIAKKFSTFASAGTSTGTSPGPKSSGGGHCCGGGCHSH